MRVVLEFPKGWVRKVWIVHILSSSLQPSDSLHLFVSEEECWLEAEVFGNQHKDAEVES